MLLIFNKLSNISLLFLYNIVIYVYRFLIYLAHFFNSKAHKLYTGRQDTFRQLQNALHDHNYRIAWFHCASLGEFEQACPLIEKFKEYFSSYKVLLTFYSPSGYDIRKNYLKADYVAYLSHDSRKQAKKFIDLIKPSFFFLIKYEFWLNHLNVLADSSCRMFLVSAVFRKNDIFFQPYGKLFLKALRNFEYIFLQDEHSQDLLQTYHLNNCKVNGDTRVDRVLKRRHSKLNLKEIEIFKNKQTLIVLGSVWQSDLKIIASILNYFTEPLKIIAAPHDVSAANIQTTSAYFAKKKIIKYSQISFKNADTLANYDLILIDSIGLLASLYAYSNFVYIGGGFGKGLHNTLEPATYHIPVIVGPQFQKFNEVINLVEKKAFFKIKNTLDFKIILDKLYTDKTLVQKSAGIIKNYLENNKGASEKIMDYLGESL